MWLEFAKGARRVPLWPMKNRILATVCILLFGLSCTFAKSMITGREVTYTDHSGQVYKGYVALPQDFSGTLPVVLVVHEWWGHNAYARHRANMLAELGYIGFAVDMYGEGKNTIHPSDAKGFAMAATKDIEDTRSRFEAALDFIREQEGADGERIAAIGYCFGGGVVLNMARLQVEGLDAVASFHGSLASPATAPEGLNARVAVFNGAADPMVPAEQVTAFKAEMEQAGAELLFENYEGVLHSFTSREANYFAQKYNLPLGYDEAADTDSWEKLRGFLADTFSE